MSIGSDGQREREPHNELTVSEVFKDGWPTVKVPFVMVWGLRVDLFFISVEGILWERGPLKLSNNV